MPKTSRRSPCRPRKQTAPGALCFNIDHKTGAYYLSSSDGDRRYLKDEPAYEPTLDVPNILTLLTAGKQKIILCAPPTILVIELGDVTDFTRSFEGFGYVAPRTVAAMLAQGWLHGDGVFGLTDAGIAAAATLASQEPVSH